MSCIVQSGLTWFATYLPWFSLHLLLSDDDYGVELGYPVVTRPPVSRERWCTAGWAVDRLEVDGGIEEAATGAECCCRMSRWKVVCRSTRLRGRAVGHRVFRLEVSFLNVLLTDTPFWINEFCWSEWPLFIPVTCSPACSAIGWLAELVGMARWM